MEKLRSIQALRALAACAVVVLHAWPEAHAPVGKAGYGAAGVDLFFVISGFIMANIARGRSAAGFLADRLWRIYPLWWIAVFPWLFWLWRGPTFIASSLTLWPIYGAYYYVPLLKVGWTLSFELLFYLGMTLAIATRAWGPLGAYSVFFIGGLLTSNPLLHFVGSPMALEFLMGIFVARLPRRRVLGFLIPLALVLLALTQPGIGDIESSLLHPQFALRRSLEWGTLAALFLWGGLSLETVFKNGAFDIPVALGDASYSIYLFHPIIAYGFNIPPAIRVLVAIGLGLAMHIVAERPILGARTRWLRRTAQGRPIRVPLSA